jgi:hypothetical protein
VRGGGGNFGVVTSFLFKAQPVHTHYGGPMLWPMEDAAEMMRWYREFIVKAPDDLYGFFAFHTVPPAAPFPEHLHNKKMCGIVWCYTGPIKKGEKIFKPIRSFKAPALDMVGPIPHPVLQSMHDGFYPPGLQWYWKADFRAYAARRSHRGACEIRGEPAVDAVDHAPVPDQRRRRSRQEQCHAVGLSRRNMEFRDCRGRPRPGATRKKSPRGRRSIGARFIPTPQAAPTSTS